MRIISIARDVVFMTRRRQEQGKFYYVPLHGVSGGFTIIPKKCPKNDDELQRRALMGQA